MKRKSLLLLLAAAVLGIAGAGLFIVPNWTGVRAAREKRLLRG